MRVFGFIPAHSSKKRPRLIAPKLLASAVTAALFATVVALGGSAAATTTGSPRASISISSPTAMGAAAAKYYLQQSGKGNKVLRSVRAPLQVVPDMEVRLRNEKGRLRADIDEKRPVFSNRRPPGPGSWRRRPGALQEGRHLQVRGQDRLQLDGERVGEPAWCCQVGNDRRGGVCPSPRTS